MDMSTMTTSMASSTTSGMTMATASSTSMSSMDMSSSEMMSASMMIMAFFTSTKTALFSEAWTPQSTGAYAGTCIFLIVLSAIFRAILAIRMNFDSVQALLARRRDPANILGSDKLAGATARPWSVNEALKWAMLDTVLAGVGYLLMVAVMTMNVGYFMSVLGGAFLGSFVFGGWTGPAETHTGCC